MVESNIEKRLSKNVDSAVEYISDWAKQRLDEWRLDARNPVITKNKDGYQIGFDSLTKRDNEWIRLNPHGEITEHYFNKNIAVIHTLLDFTGRRKDADDIIKHNNRICKLTVDLKSYEAGKVRALKKDNYDMADVFDARINLAQSQIDSSWHQLRKTLELTKYIKIWKD